jgi:hypothetical protein
MKSCCRENEYAVGNKAINPVGLRANPLNMIEKCFCNHAAVSLFSTDFIVDSPENTETLVFIGRWCKAKKVSFVFLS